MKRFQPHRHIENIARLNWYLCALCVYVVNLLAYNKKAEFKTQPFKNKTKNKCNLIFFLRHYRIKVFNGIKLRM